MMLRVSVNFDPIAPLRFRRWLRVNVSGQGPPKPSPAAEAQRSSYSYQMLHVRYTPNDARAEHPAR